MPTKPIVVGAVAYTLHVVTIWEGFRVYFRAAGGACQVLGMRDQDVDYLTRFIARTDAGLRSLTDLKGKRFAYGSADSAQAALIPAYYLRQAGLDPERDVRPLHFDLDVGK